jgi:large subunit ribosomal protein L25
MQLTAEKREVLGKKTKYLRSEGKVPAELYGRGIDNVHLSVLTDDFKTAYKEAGKNAVIELKFGDEKRPVMVYDVHRHPATGDIQNIDFYQVKMDEVVQADVALDFIGESPAVKDKEGVLVKAMQSLSIEALPANIPQNIEVDISVLEDIDQSITVKDLPLADLEKKDVKILVELDSVVVTIKAQMTEEEDQAKAEEGANIEGIEVEGGEKQEEGEAEAEEGKAEGGEEKKEEAKED